MLFLAREQKEHLRLKGIARAVGIKIREEGILFKDFQQHFGAEGRLQEAGEAGFAHANDTINRNIHRRFKFQDSTRVRAFYLALGF